MAFQPEDERSSGRPHSKISVPKEANKKATEGLLARPCSDRTKTSAFKLKYGRLTLDIKKNWIFWGEVAQRKCGCAFPESV